MSDHDPECGCLVCRQSGTGAVAMGENETRRCPRCGTEFLTAAGGTGRCPGCGKLSEPRKPKDMRN